MMRGNPSGYSFGLYCTPLTPIPQLRLCPNGIASDIPAILAYTRRVLILEEGEIAVLHPDNVVLTTLNGTPIQRTPLTIDWDAEAAEKGCPVSKVLNAKISMTAKLG